MQHQRGLSPLIATVLLIGLVVTIGVIIFIWFQNLIGETITKFGDENVERACESVSLQATRNGQGITITNNGNVPLNSLKLRIDTGDERFTESPQLEGGVSVGSAVTVTITNPTLDLETIRSVDIIPVLTGNDESGYTVAYSCDNHPIEVRG